ncbi:hypothetical protein HW445_32145, partial [Streptomyces sp. UH6]|nr:hypothetical protein [Streptomyces sp. UH6]
MADGSSVHGGGLSRRRLLASSAAAGGAAWLLRGLVRPGGADAADA